MWICFATRFSHRLPLYVSPVQDYKALAIDALSMDWNHLHALCFSSFYSDTCCSRKNPTTSVQNNSHSSVLATITVVLRISSSISVSPDSSATNFKTTNLIQRKICPSKSPNSRSNNQSEIRNFRKRCRFCLQIKKNIYTKSLRCEMDHLF